MYLQPNFNQTFDMGNQTEFFSKVLIVFYKAIKFFSLKTRPKILLEPYKKRYKDRFLSDFKCI